MHDMKADIAAVIKCEIVAAGIRFVQDLQVNALVLAQMITYLHGTDISAYRCK